MSTKTKTHRKNSKAALKQGISTLTQDLAACRENNQVLRNQNAELRGQVNQLQAEIRGLNDVGERAKRLEHEFQQYREQVRAKVGQLTAEQAGAVGAFSTALEIVSSIAAKNGHADRSDLPNLEGLGFGGGSSHPLQALRSALLQAVAEARG